MSESEDGDVSQTQPRRAGDGQDELSQSRTRKVRRVEASVSVGQIL